MTITDDERKARTEELSALEQTIYPVASFEDSALCVIPHTFIPDRWIGKRVLVNAKAGSYFCILKSIHMDEPTSSYVKVEDAWLVDLGRQKSPDNGMITNCSLSMISVSRVCAGREFAIKDVISIETSEDTIKKMQRVIDEVMGR